MVYYLSNLIVSQDNCFATKKSPSIIKTILSHFEIVKKSVISVLIDKNSKSKLLEKITKRKMS